MEQQKLEKQLNEYVRLYADSQADNEKLRLDARRLEAAVESEKAQVENRLGKELKRVRAALQLAEEQNTEVCALSGLPSLGMHGGMSYTFLQFMTAILSMPSFLFEHPVDGRKLSVERIFLAATSAAAATRYSSLDFNF